MSTPITTTAFVGQLFDLWASQGLAFDDLAAAKAAAVPIFQNWLGGDDALPAEIGRQALTALGRTNSFVLNQYDVWTTPADGGPNEDGTVNVLLPDGSTEPVPGWQKIIDATQKGYAGWSPVLVTAADGPARVVMRVTDWTGGEGTKPPTGYLGASGVVSGIGDAVDIFAAVSALLTEKASAASGAADDATAAAATAEAASSQGGQLSQTVLVEDLDLSAIVGGLGKALSVGADGRVYIGRAQLHSLEVEEAFVGALRLLSASLASAGEITGLGSGALGDLVFGVEAMGAVPVYVGVDGSLNARSGAIDKLSAESLRVGSVAIETAGLKVAATLRALSALAQGGREWAVTDEGGRVALEVSAQGVVGAERAEIGRLLALRAQIQRAIIVSPAGESAGEMAAAGGGQAGFSDAAGRLALAIDLGGRVEMPMEPVLPFVGGKAAASADHLVVARPRRGSLHGRHDLYVTDLATGSEVQLTSDSSDATDYLNPAIVGAHCLYTRRTGWRSVLAARPLAGGDEVPVFPHRDLHMLGDSFVTPDLKAAIFAGLADQRRAFTTDGVGGSTLTEQLARWALTPQYHNRTLIIMDGGLESDAATALARLANIRDLLAPVCKRWLFVQPSPQELAAGTPSRNTFDATVAAVAAAFPDNFVECLTALKAGNDGSPEDLADVANNIVPRSLRIDSIHETPAGSAIRGGLVAAALNTKGW